MGKRGPSPKPTTLKLHAGTYRKDRVAAREPIPDVAFPEPPKQLRDDVPWGPVAVAEWYRLGAELVRLKLMSQVDRGAFAAYCDAWGRWLYWRKRAADVGWTQMTETGYVAPRPEGAYANRALEDLNRWGAKFGLSPADRTRVNAAPEDSGNDETRFFGAG